MSMGRREEAAPRSYGRLYGRLYATLRVDNLRCAVDARVVQEVLRAQPLTEVPLARMEVAGLMNLRGHVVTVIDLRARLHLPWRPEDESPLNLVVHTVAGRVSLLVDALGDVIRIDEDRLTETPESLGPVLGAAVSGVYELDGEQILVLDVEEVCQLGRRLPRGAVPAGTPT